MSQKEGKKKIYDQMGNTPEYCILESIQKKDKKENKKRNKKHKKKEKQSEEKDNNKKMSRKKKIKKLILSLFIAKPEKEIVEEKDSFSESSNLSIPA